MTRHILGGAAIAVALLGTAPGFAANTDTKPMTAEALILKPLTLTRQSDLSFGTIIPSGSGDLVTINADTGARSSPSANLVLTDPGFRARFASSGLNNQFVVLALSPPADLVDVSNGNLLTLVNLSLDNGGNPLRILTPASQTFFVGIGGTVFVRANQQEGTYTGTFTLTANYL